MWWGLAKPTLNSMPRLLIMFLLASSVLTLGAPQLASSQTQTAETVTQYSNGTTTTTEYSTKYMTATNTGILHYQQRPGDYSNRTSLFTLGQYDEMIVINRPLPIPDEPRDYICLYYDYFVFNVEALQEVRGHFEASKPVNFYVMSLRQLGSFERSLCGYGGWNSDVNVFASSYDLDWIASQSGQYVFLFASHRPYGSDITISFNAQTYSTTVQTTTLSHTVTSTQVVQNIRTIVSTESSMNTTSPPFDNLILAALVIAGLLAVIGLIVIKMKRTKPRRGT